MKPTLALRSFLLGSISLAVSPLIHAANIWDGGGANDNSNTALNWDNNAVPSANAQLTFAGAVRPTVVWNGITSPINVSGFTFSAGAAAFQINSGTETAVQFIANGTSTLLNSSSNLQTLGIESRVFFNGTKTFNGSTAGLALNGGILFRGDSMTNGQINRLDLIGSGDSTTSSISRVGFAGTATTSLVKNGTGKWTVTGNYSDTGSINVSGGTLVFAGSSSGTLGAITVSGGGTTELKIQAGSYTQGAGGFFVGSDNGAGIVSQTDGTVAWNSTNLQLLIGNGNAGFAGTYNLSGGSLTTLTGTPSRGVMLGVNSGNSATFNLSGTGTLTVAGTSRLMIGRSDATQVNTTNLFSQTGGTATISDMTMGGTIGGAGSGNSATLTLTGGTFSATTFSLLSAANNDVSTINIGGTAVVTLPAFPTARGTGTTTTINFDGGTLKNSVASATYMNAQAATTAFIKVGGAQFDTSNGSITITQNLLTHGSSLNGGLTKIGTNTLTLSGTNTYTGGTTVSAGILTTGSAGALGSTSGQLTVNTGGTLDMGSQNLTVGNLTGTGGTISGTSGTRTLTIGQGDGTGGNYQGAIQNGAAGTTALTKTGTGTITLSGTNNTYTGATNISNGTLLINGSISTSIVTVANGATLGGSGGTVGGATTVNGTLASGSSVGTLNFSSSLALAATSTYLFELNNTTNVADLTNVAGTINIASGATLDLEQLGAYAIGDKFTLFAYLTGSLTGTFNTLIDGAEFTDAGGVWKINYSDTSSGLNGGTGTSFVTISAIPEPSAALLGALGLFALLRRRRN